MNATANSRSSRPKRDSIRVRSRRLVQDAAMAIRDVYDAVVELVTNADDRYQILGMKGRVEIELGRRGRNQPSLLRVRDFADGMTTDDMIRKLGQTGGRVSGMEQGRSVRGTNSRGAKDIAALGAVTYRSVKGGRIHCFRIFPEMEYEAEKPVPATRKLSAGLGIRGESGTVVEVDVRGEITIPKPKTFIKDASRLVALRDILQGGDTAVFARGLKGGRWSKLRYRQVEGKRRVSEKIEVRGRSAKLAIYRARRRFKDWRPRFRRGGLLIKSRHAIHESTLIDSKLKSDPCGQWFYGRLVCEAIDDFWNEYDDRVDQRLEPLKENPVPILDPTRKTGLNRNHPFAKALLEAALPHLERLVEEERTREARQRVGNVESKQTRKRLKRLGKAATRFMNDSSEGEEEISRDGGIEGGQSRFVLDGYTLSPPFARLVLGESRNYQLKVRAEAFAELAHGDAVSVECDSKSIRVRGSGAPLEMVEDRADLLRAKWSVDAVDAVSTTGVVAKVGPIRAEGLIQVFASEAELYAEQYSDLDALRFERKEYGVRGGSPKSVRLLAPLDRAEEGREKLELKLSSDDYRAKVVRPLKADRRKGIAVAKVSISLLNDDAKPAQIKARLGSEEAKAALRARPFKGSDVSIRVQDADYSPQRYRWNRNVLEIGARHASLKRYLGPRTDRYPRQDEIHCRVLFAEIVAEAVCERALRWRVEAQPRDYEGEGWEGLFRDYSRMMSRFLPEAHRYMVEKP